MIVHLERRNWGQSHCDGASYGDAHDCHGASHAHDGGDAFLHSYSRDHYPFCDAFCASFRDWFCDGDDDSFLYFHQIHLNHCGDGGDPLEACSSSQMDKCIEILCACDFDLEICAYSFLLEQGQVPS